MTLDNFLDWIVSVMAGICVLGALAFAAWTLIGIVWLFHANAKFNDCYRQWQVAHEHDNHADMKLYYHCEEIAHEDSFIWTWPATIVNRWNADYVAEARKGLR